ncbi:MAG: hypothetical protein ACE5QW_03610 [Thermoplasmata archaeon]
MIAWKTSTEKSAIGSDKRTISGAIEDLKVMGVRVILKNNGHIVEGADSVRDECDTTRHCGGTSRRKRTAYLGRR